MSASVKRQRMVAVSTPGITSRTSSAADGNSGLAHIAHISANSTGSDIEFGFQIFAVNGICFASVVFDQIIEKFLFFIHTFSPLLESGTQITMNSVFLGLYMFLLLGSCP